MALKLPCTSGVGLCRELKVEALKLPCTKEKGTRGKGTEGRCLIPEGRCATSPNTGSARDLVMKPTFSSARSRVTKTHSIKKELDQNIFLCYDQCSLYREGVITSDGERHASKTHPATESYGVRSRCQTHSRVVNGGKVCSVYSSRRIRTNSCEIRYTGASLAATIHRSFNQGETHGRTAR